MLKKEIMKHYKKGTEIKLVSLDGSSEVRGHVCGYWKMMEGGWGVECLIVGQEKPIQVSTEDVIRVFKDKPKEEEVVEQTEADVINDESQVLDIQVETVMQDEQTEDKPAEGTPENPIEINPGDVVDDDGNVIRKAPPVEGPHPMEKAAAPKFELGSELTEEMNKLESVATKIRFLLGKGMGRSQVAKALGVDYRYVYAIEHKPLKRELPLVIIPHHNKAKS